VQRHLGRLGDDARGELDAVDPRDDAPPLPGAEGRRSTCERAAHHSAAKAATARHLQAAECSTFTRPAFRRRVITRCIRYDAPRSGTYPCPHSAETNEGPPPPRYVAGDGRIIARALTAAALQDQSACGARRRARRNEPPYRGADRPGGCRTPPEIYAGQQHPGRGIVPAWRPRCEPCRNSASLRDRLATAGDETDEPQDVAQWSKAAAQVEILVVNAACCEPNPATNKIAGRFRHPRRAALATTGRRSTAASPGRFRTTPSRLFG